MAVHYFKAVSDDKVKTNLLVRIQIGASSHDYEPCSDLRNQGSARFWVTIPKGEKESQEIKNHIGANGILFARPIPLPTVNILGEGEVIDQESLQDEFGGELTEHLEKIPEDFLFPYYEIPEDSGIYLYGEEASKIVSVSHPNGSFIRRDTDIMITFDKPPICPEIDHRDLRLRGGNTEFTVPIPNWRIDQGTLWKISFTLSWGNKGSKTDRSETFEYKVTR